MSKPWKHPVTGIYWFNRGVPADVRPYVGKSRWKKTLDTRSYSEAERRILPLLTETNEIIEQVRAGRFRSRTDDELREIIAAMKFRDRGIGLGDAAEPVELPPRTDEEVRRGVITSLDQHGPQIDPESPDFDRLFQIALEAERRVVFTKPRPKVKRPGEALALSRLLERYKAETDAEERTLMDWATAVERFVSLFGDKSALEITRADARQYRDALKRFPRQAPNDVKKGPVQDALAWADQHDADRLSPATINKALAAIRAILSWAEKETDLLDDQPDWSNPFAGINVKEKNGGQRLPYSEHDLKAIFASPVWTGCKSKGRRGEPGDSVIRDAKFWLPLLGLFTGARLEELAQLHRSDVQRQDGVDFLLITDEGEDQNVKTTGSKRRVPIHPELIRLGFLDHVRSQSDLIFPDLTAYRGRYGYQFSKWWGRYARTVVGITDSRKTFHSFRHGWKDRARECELDMKVADALQGHTDGSVSGGYGKGYSIKRLAEEMAKIEFTGLDLKR